MKWFISWILLVAGLLVISLFFFPFVFYVGFPALALYALSEMSIKENPEMSRHRKIFNIITTVWIILSSLDVIFYYSFDRCLLYNIFT